MKDERSKVDCLSPLFIAKSIKNACRIITMDGNSFIIGIKKCCMLKRLTFVCMWSSIILNGRINNQAVFECWLIRIRRCNNE